ncbi:4217_t:CDS:2, partial [Gigaspora margarita]
EKNDKSRNILCQVAGIIFMIQCKYWIGSNKINHKITYAHCEMTTKCAKHYKSVVIGIIVVPLMSVFMFWLIEATKTA